MVCTYEEYLKQSKAITFEKMQIKIAIIDGVIYIDKCAGQKMAYKMRNNFSDDEVILSAVLLRD